MNDHPTDDNARRAEYIGPLDDFTDSPSLWLPVALIAAVVLILALAGIGLWTVWKWS